MTAQEEPRLFDLGRSDDQRMNQETMQRFAANEIRAVARQADETAATPGASTTRPRNWGYPCSRFQKS